MLPNISPIIKIAMVSLIFDATIITANKTKKLPKLAAIAIEKLLIVKILPVKKENPNTNKDTPRLAPELIPKTNGPANGFLNNVCINNPLSDNPLPTRMAVKALGSLL